MTMISLVSIFLSERGGTAPVQNLSLTVTGPAEGAVRSLAGPVNDIFGGLTNHGALTRENEQLRDEVEKYKAQLAAEQGAQQRVRDLESALGLRQSRPDDQLTAANVIAEEPSGLKKAVAIDRGLNDGLSEGMVVLSRNGSLIGTISRVYKDFAWVRLLTDPDSAINAQVNSAPAGTPAPTPQVLTPGSPAAQPSASAGAQPSVTPAPATPTPSPVSTPPAEPVRGIIDGDLSKTLTLNLVPAGSAVQSGDLVVTSGHGGNYPRSLLIGSIKEVDRRPQSPFIQATVEPAANLTGLDEVLILVSFKPARLTGP